MRHEGRHKQKGSRALPCLQHSAHLPDAGVDLGISLNLHQDLQTLQRGHSCPRSAHGNMIRMGREVLLTQAAGQSKWSGGRGISMALWGSAGGAAAWSKALAAAETPCNCAMQVTKRAEKDLQASSKAACYEGLPNAGP